MMLRAADGRHRTASSFRAAPALLLAAGALAIFPGCSAPPRPADKRTNGKTCLLTPNPPRVDLGAVPQGGRTTFAFQVHNPTDQAIEVAAIHTSCPCLEVTMEPTTLVPSGTAKACGTLDLRDETGFPGKLAIEVQGLTRRGEKAFVVEVEVSVHPEG